MFKLIASDLDGTLLKNNAAISQYSVSILEAAAQAGIPFIICTGRMYDSLKEILPALPFCRYAITSMGAEIYDNFEKKRIYSKPLEHEYAEVLITYALKHNIHMHLYINDILYTSALDQYSDLYFRHTTSMGRPIPGNIFTFIKEKDISKILYMGEPADIAEHSKHINELLKDKIHNVSSDPMFAEFASLKAGKDTALKALCAQLDINMDELIVFGDSGNDIAMLQNTGFSCAVANAWDEAKKAADIIVESNENDGVAKTVRRLILEYI
jgi:cof-like hydrolase